MRIDIGVEMTGFDEPALAVIVAMKVDRAQRANGERDFAGGIAGQGEAGDHGMFEALAVGGVRATELSTGEILLERGGADGDAIEFDRGAGGDR